MEFYSLYQFQARNNKELSIEPGDIIQVSDFSTFPWVYGTSQTKGTSGMIPQYYLLKSPPLHLTLEYEESTKSLIEWRKLMTLFIKNGNFRDYRYLKRRSLQLIKLRRQGSREQALIKHIDKTNERIGNLPYVRLEGIRMSLSNFKFSEMHRQFKERILVNDISSGIFIRTLDEIQTSPIFQVILDFHMAIVPTREEGLLHFFLYSVGKKSQLTETYEIPILATGMHEEIDLHGKLKTIFSDIKQLEVETGLYLVCRFYRKGRLISSEKLIRKYSTFRKYRTPFAVGILHLTKELVSSSEDQEIDATMPVKACRDPSMFYELHRMMIDEDEKVISIDGAIGVKVCIRVLQNQFIPEKLIPFGDTLSPLSELHKCEVMALPDVILPSWSRSDLYLKLLGGSFSDTNIKVRLSIRRNSGFHDENDKIQNCIGVDILSDEYESYVNLRNGEPKWNEIVKIRLSDKIEYQKSHVYFEIFHCITNEKRPNKLFAFTFIKFIDENGTFLHQGEHSLSLYKIQKGDPLFYLNSGSNLKKKKGFLKININLCSTELTQTDSIISLINWKSNSNDTSIPTLLKQVTFAHHIEIVKFIKEILNSLFSILGEGGEIFETFCFVVGIIVDSKFKNFRPVLDDYIHESFEGSSQPLRHLAQIHNSFLDILIDRLSRPTEVRRLIGVMRVVEYLFKFIIASYKLDVRITSSRGTFKDKIINVVDLIINLMQLSEPLQVVGAQSMLLRHFDAIFQEIDGVIDGHILVEKAAKLFSSLELGKRKILNLAKLELFIALIKRGFFDRSDIRGRVMGIINNHLKFHVQNDEEEMQLVVSFLQRLFGRSENPSYIRDTAPLYQICIDALNYNEYILNQKINNIKVKIESARNEERTLGSSSQISNLVGLITKQKNEIIIENEKANRLKQEIIVALLNYQAVITPGNFNHIEYGLSRNTRDSDYVLQILKIYQSLVIKPIFPHKWGDILKAQMQIIFKSLRAMSFTIRSTNNNAIIIDTIRLLCELITQNQSMEISIFLRSIWKSIKNKHLYTSITEELLKLVQLPSPIREIGFEIYISLFKAVFNISKSFKEIEQPTVGTIAKLIDEGQIENFTSFLFPNLRKELSETNEEMRNELNEFLENVKSLINRIKQVTESVNEEEKSKILIDLIKYLKATKRYQLYSKYSHELSRLHENLNHPIQAGISFTYIFELLNFSDKHLPMFNVAGYDYPSETESERKEKTMCLAIDLLDRGQDWERAIKIIRKLKNFHKFNNERLSELILKESKMFRQIATIDRFYPSFFFVSYKTQDFGELSNKSFIYQGEILEQLISFMSQIKKKFPDSEISADDTKNIQLFTVQPSSFNELNKSNLDEEHEEGVLKPLFIRKYEKFNNLQVFRYDKPFKKTKTGNEFLDMWLERRFIILKRSFPCETRRIEVKELKKIEISPGENAVHEILSKNSEILTAIQKYERMNTKENVNPFSMILNGCIDAAVNGGVMNYLHFLSDEFINSGGKLLAKKLRDGLSEQLKILDIGSTLHGRIVSAEMRPFHVKMCKMLESLKRDLTPVLSSVQNL